MECRESLRTYVELTRKPPSKGSVASAISGGFAAVETAERLLSETGGEGSELDRTVTAVAACMARVRALEAEAGPALMTQVLRGMHSYLSFKFSDLRCRQRLAEE
jgi:hypothetical protein